MKLAGRRVVITGASRGIGAALANELSTTGAQLTLLARSEEHLAAVAEPIGASHLVLDVTNADARARTIAAIEADGSIDVWINNAGISPHGAFVDHDPADISNVFAVNLEAPIQFCRAVLPSMIDRGVGHIVNVSSMAMAVNTPLFATYGASKAGLSSFAESLRVELRDTGVDLTTVEIGETNTQMLSDLRTNAEVDEMYRFYEKLKLQRLVEPEEVAVAIRVAIEETKPFVRLPKRAAGFPAIVNLPRSISNVLQRGQ